MKHNLIKALLFFFICIPAVALADIAVLVHGYHATGGSWRHKGITYLLESKGWKDAGYYAPLAGNIGHLSSSLNISKHWVVTAELPSEAAIEIQADFLGQYLQDISKRFPNQSIHLIAHSAGGLVARLALINNSYLTVTQLITIATPHMGSPMAEVAEMTSDSPLSILAPLAGVKGLNRSEKLFSQLSREKENYFLFWLNRQLHPDISYVSIIRASGSILNGDRYVPPYSQDMALVPAIGQRSRKILTPGNHKLKYADGIIIASLLP